MFPKFRIIKIDECCDNLLPPAIRMAPEAEARRRLIPQSPDEPDISHISEEDRNALDSYLARNKSNINGHTILWMVAGMMVFNYTDFLNVLMYDGRIKEGLFQIGASLMAVNIAVGAYLVIYMSYIRGKRDWARYTHKALIPVATVCGLIGMVLCTVALWPVWGFLTIPIVFTLFMGVLMLATLLPF